MKKKKWRRENKEDTRKTVEQGRGNKERFGRKNDKREKNIN